ncbi:aldo/keto reductase [Ruania rhizosphaerae]|uniref:aldo/keto reductase n=1 Tax=Ruania rhizosphaerae TaxID=1840413 RepID=UPI001356EF73|nr:aldo/keto reductase [Ruania rhizosphaerae]
MKYREFGRTGLRVSTLSYGAMRATGDAAHMARRQVPSHDQIERENRAGAAALEAALDAGVNCIHSSGDYGTWWLLGEVLRRRREREEVHHVIKVTTPDYTEERLDSARVVREVEDALRHLGAERISFVQHLQRGPYVSKEDAYATAGDSRRIAALPVIAEEFGAVIDDLQQQGKVGCAITFPHTMGYARAALETGVYGGTAHFLNALEPEALDLVAEQRGRTGFFGIRPLLQGLLTDARIDRESLAKDDLKRGPAWDTRYEALARLRAAVAAPDSWTSWAIRFALTPPQVSSLIVSARTPEQVESLVAAAEQEALSPHEHAAAVGAVLDGPAMPKSDLFVENLV